MNLRVLFCSIFVVVTTGLSEEHTKPLFRDFMGINGHTIQFRPKLYKPTATLVRDYHPVSWDLGDDTDFETPFPFARNGVNWKTVYGSWREEDLRIDVSLMFETIEPDQWKNMAADARAYGERFARAFGQNAETPLVEAAEIGNEPGRFSDADYRTIFENMAIGLRAGDPDLKIVTCNLTTRESHAYAKSVTCLEGLNDLYDVLSVHSYAQLENWPTWRRSFPEDPALKEYLPDIRDLCAWRDEHAPDKEVWLTEFGYDSSTQKPPATGDFKDWVDVTDEQQALWLVRSWLVFATLPIDRAYLYFFNDEDTPQFHGSSGLTRHFQPKPSYHAVSHLRQTLGDYRFHQTLADRPGDAMLFEFTHETDTKKMIWVAWSPTGKGRSAELELPAFAGTIKHAEGTPLTADKPTEITLEKDGRRVTITEAPLFLFLHAD